MAEPQNPLPAGLYVLRHERTALTIDNRDPSRPVVFNRFRENPHALTPRALGGQERPTLAYEQDGTPVLYDLHPDGRFTEREERRGVGRVVTARGRWERGE